MSSKLRTLDKKYYGETYLSKKRQKTEKVCDLHVVEDKKVVSPADSVGVLRTITRKNYKEQKLVNNKEKQPIQPSRKSLRNREKSVKDSYEQEVENRFIYCKVCKEDIFDGCIVHNLIKGNNEISMCGQGTSDQENVKSESEESDQFDTELSEYERRRMENIKANAEFFSSLKINVAKESFLSSVGHPKKKAPQPKKRVQVLPLRQRSYRLQRKDPDANPLPEPVPIVNPEEIHGRKCAGPLTMTTCLVSTDEEEEKLCDDFHKKLMTISTKIYQKSCPSKSLLDLRLKESNIVKIVKDRIFSIAVHPDRSVILAAAGDKCGKIGFFNVIEKDDSKRVHTYEPHSSPVNCLRFTDDVLYSCSYDGTVRGCDLQKCVFDEYYRSSDEFEERCISFDFYDTHSLVVGMEYGEVIGVDTRTSCDELAFSHQVHDRLVKAVSIYPQQQNYIFTSTNNGIVSLWDLRNMKKKPESIKDLPHSRSVNTVKFSPSGKHLVTTSMENVLRVYDTSDINNIELKVAKCHDCRVGRWLTNFRASWHHNAGDDEMFVIGAMKRPRVIMMMDTQGKVVNEFESDNLSSVCSINEFHPSRNILVGGNSSGRLHVFM